MSGWHDKVVLITGATAGLGLALARRFVASGARTVMAARRADRLQSVTGELVREGGQVIGIAADVTCDEQVETLIGQAVQHFGGLDVLVNNVGRSMRSSVLETSVEDFQELMAVNFYSVVRCTRVAMPHLIESHGHVVNIGSLSAKTVSPFLSAYAASKFAVAAYTQQLRIEGPRQVHFLLVCPGPIARADAGGRYDAQVDGLPEKARQPGGGAKLRTITPESLSKRILRACERRQAELVVPARARVLFVVSQLWPRLGDWILRRWT